MTVLCAEPGMGKTYAVSQLVQRCDKTAQQAYVYSYEGLPSDVACRRIIRCCHNRVAEPVEKGSLIVFDGITAGDEAEVEREARSLRRLVAIGAQVVVCLRPEAEQLLECLPEAYSLRAEDLLFRSRGNAGSIMDLTGGIPCLVAAVAADRSLHGTEGQVGPRYGARLEDLVRKTLRDGLPHEELRTRFAMLLLGRGTLDEIRMVAGRCDIEQLSWLGRDVPLLGIDLVNRSFCCHGLSRDDLLDCCGQALHAFGATEPTVVVRACGALAARGDVRRSAMVSRFCPSERDHAMVCMTWGVSYAGIGETRLVSDALRYARLSGMDLGARGTLSAVATATILATSQQMDRAWESLSTLRIASSVEESLLCRVQLLGVCRDTLRNPRQASRSVRAEPHDAVGIACLDHLRVTRMLAAGRFDETYAVMVNEMLVREPKSLPEALLCDDLLLALSLCGGVPDQGEQNLFDQSEAFFARVCSKRLQAYHAALANMPSILMSSNANAHVVEEAALRAERAGDTFVQGLFLGVCAVADVRAHAFSRSHVRAERAGRLLRALGEEYLASCAELVDAISLSLLSERGRMAAYCAAEGRPISLALLGKALTQKEEGRLDGQLQRAIPLGTACPRDIVWVLNLIENGCEGAFGNLSDLVPLEWVELMRVVKYRQAKAASIGAGATAVSGRPSVVPGGSGELGRGSQTEMKLVDVGEGRIRVSVLGSFEVRRDGVILAEGSFERRRARDLIEVLAIVPGHRMRRSQAIDVLWPNDEFDRGPRRLYEAVSEARKSMGGLDARDNPLIADKAQGSIGFDTALVSCDVDDFEREARTVVLEDGDDFLVLEHARRMDQIYSGGLDAQLLALGGLVSERAEALTTLYVDALIAAGEAALRLGKAKLAVRYGMDAHVLFELREDAAILVVRALRAAGRAFEIADFYRRFSRNLMAKEGTPPSMSLRRTVDYALSDGPGLLPA